ncbi:hypothetical protein ATKI12_7281 [Kitasatospora sp. Ki12]|uniref:hypothetical protein n=1 Tax=Kitasatospora xanthocidica TaxID=83382 RepID=UPI0016781AE3|nr:hypothetical protein [Kitasatospora xanthocidica]GHF55909.1 hypothetical protein GCM10018790_37280 [Kitasatospora xanthocidica]
MPSLLYAVALNPALPPELLGRLIEAADADGDLAEALADRPDLGPEQVCRLAGRDEETAVRLAYGGLLRAADVDPVTRPLVALALLDEGRGDPAWARQLARDPDPYVRMRLGSCPGLPDETADLLAVDESVDVVSELGLYSERPDLLVRLAAHPEAEVRRWVAANEAAPPGLLTALLADRDVLVRRQAAGNPATPGTAAARHVDDEPTVRHQLSEHPGLPAAVYHRLAEDPAPWVRGNLADNPGIDLPLMHRLAADDDPDVRRRLAHHPAIPLDLVERLAVTVRIGAALLPRVAAAGPAEVTRLAASSEPRVRMLVARRRDLPAAVRDALAADPDAAVANSVAPHPGLTSARLTALLDRFAAKVATGLAANPDAPTALLDRIAATEPVPVKALRAIAAHPHAGPAALARCLASPDERTAEAAAANPALPAEVIAALTEEAAAAEPDR